MARARTHDDGCGIAHASDLLGQRWALLVVRELLLGPKRFTDLRAGIPDISPNVLGQRLRELEESGIVRRRKLAPPAAVQVYELTEWGHELEPGVLALGRWASQSPSFPRGVEMGPDSLVLALKSTFQPEKADGLEAVYELRLGDVPFNISVKGGEFRGRSWRGREPRRGDSRATPAPSRVSSSAETGWGRRWIPEKSRSRAAAGPSTPSSERSPDDWRLPSCGITFVTDRRPSRLPDENDERSRHGRRNPARSRAEIVDEASKWGVGAGILVTALAPLSLPILILTLVAVLPLVVPLLAVGLVAAVVALPVFLIRKLGRSVSRITTRRRRRTETAPRPATGH